MEQPSDKTSQEQARESLIEISYTSPEEEEYITTFSDVKPVISTTTTNGATKGGSTDDEDRLRAELISISYDESPSPSPDVDVVAVSPTLPNGICRG